VIVGVVGVVAPCIPPITAPATHPVASHFAAPIIVLFFSPESPLEIAPVIAQNGFEGILGACVVGVVGVFISEPIQDESI